MKEREKREFSFSQTPPPYCLDNDTVLIMFYLNLGMYCFSATDVLYA